MPSLLLSLPSISLLWVTVLSVFSFALHFVSLSLLYLFDDFFCFYFAMPVHSYAAPSSSRSWPSIRNTDLRDCSIEALPRQTIGVLGGSDGIPVSDPSLSADSPSDSDLGSPIRLCERLPVISMTSPSRRLSVLAAPWSPVEKA